MELEEGQRQQRAAPDNALADNNGNNDINNEVNNNDDDRSDHGPVGDEEEEEEAEHLDPQELLLYGVNPPFLMDDPARMELTAEEQQWALAIKAEIEADPEIDNISDFLCVQFAMIYKVDTRAAVEGAMRLQNFRQDNDILDTLGDSRRALSQLIQLFPKMYLSFTFDPEDGNYYFVYDMTEFSIKEFTRNEVFATFSRGNYYFGHAINVDFELMRRGVIALIECNGYDWRKNMSMKIFQSSGLLDVALCYPTKYQKNKYFNTGVMFNVFLTMLKGILPSTMGNKFETGFRLTEGGTLGSIYLQPNVAVANQRFLLALDIILQRRYNLEQSFSLSTSTTS